MSAVHPDSDALPAPAPPARDRWLAALAVAGLALLAVLYRETFATFHDTWSSNDSYSHAYLLGPIALYLVWTDRRHIFRRPFRPSLIAALLIAAGSLAWAAAHAADVRFGQQLMVVALLFGVLWAVLGTRTARGLLFPVGLLLFGVPFWSLLVPWLQDYTAVYSTAAVRALGVPIFLEGYYMTIPRGRFLVAEVCAGLNFLLATLVICALFSYLNYARLWVGTLFFTVGALTSLVANWVRVVIIVLIGHHQGMDHPLVAGHITLGWVIFTVVLLPLFAFGIWLRRLDPQPGDDRTAGSARGPAAASGADQTVDAVTDRGEPPPGGAKSAARTAPTSAALSAPGAISGARAARSGATPAGARPLVLAMAVVGLILGPLLVLRAEVGVVDVAARAIGSLPPGMAGWRGPEPLAPDLEPRLRGTPAVATGTYRRGDAEVALVIGYYPVQQQGEEATSALNQPIDTSEWTLMRRGRGTFEVDGRRLSVERLQFRHRHGIEHRDLWRWYHAGGRFATSVTEAKLRQLPALLRGDLGAALVIVSTPIDAGHDQPVPHLAEFARDMGPAIGAWLEDARP